MSEVAIANSALIKLGEPKITSFTDGSRQSIAVSEQYDKLRDDMLRAHPWNFATARKQLARSARTPPFEFSYQYPVPMDFLRALIVSDNTLATSGVYYKMGHDETDGRVFLTSASQLYLVYVRQVEDTGQMPPDFREALACRIAADISLLLTQSNAIEQRMQGKADDALAYAKAIDGMEDYPDARPEGSWATARRGYSSDCTD